MSDTYRRGWGDIKLPFLTPPKGPKIKRGSDGKIKGTSRLLLQKGREIFFNHTTRDVILFIFSMQKGLNSHCTMRYEKLWEIIKYSHNNGFVLLKTHECWPYVNLCKSMCLILYLYFLYYFSIYCYECMYRHYTNAPKPLSCASDHFIETWATSTSKEWLFLSFWSVGHFCL